jgi:hypothetical protein
VLIQMVDACGDYWSDDSSDEGFLVTATGDVPFLVDSTIQHNVLTSALSVLTGTDVAPILTSASCFSASYNKQQRVLNTNPGKPLPRWTCVQLPAAIPLALRSRGGTGADADADADAAAAAAAAAADAHRMQARSTWRKK